MYLCNCEINEIVLISEICLSFFFSCEIFIVELCTCSYSSDAFCWLQVLSDIGLVAPTAQMATLLSAQENMKVYIYYLENYISYHSVELNYVFGVPWIGGDVDELGMFNDMEKVPQDKTKSLQFMKMWTNFAKTGLVYTL